METTKVEYRVRPVTRYVVTRYCEDRMDNRSGVGVCCETKGEFDNADTGYAVAYALARQEHEQLGWPIGDERIIYPQPVGQSVPTIPCAPQD